MEAIPLHYASLKDRPDAVWAETFFLEDNTRTTEFKLMPIKDQTELSKLIYPEAEALQKYVASKYPKLLKKASNSLTSDGLQLIKTARMDYALDVRNNDILQSYKPAYNGKLISRSN